MLWTIAAILLVLWLVGVFAHWLGSVIHVLLVIGLVVIIVQLAKEKKTTNSVRKREPKE